MKAFILHIPEHLLQQAKDAAGQENMSVQQLLCGLISEGLERRAAALSMRQRAARGNPQQALFILDNVVPDVPPGDGDAV